MLTVDLAIKILSGLSSKHKRFRERGIAVGFIDEIHNVSRNQLLALASHMETLVVSGDEYQKMSYMDRMGGDCLSWLRDHGVRHDLTEVWRYGNAIQKLLQLETKNQKFQDMAKAMDCR